jgi:hypothetical protein
MRTTRSYEGRALSGLNVHVTDVCGTSFEGEEHSVLPMSNEVGAEFRPKFFPVTVIGPPAVGLIPDTNNTAGGSEGENQEHGGCDLLSAP